MDVIRIVRNPFSGRRLAFNKMQLLLLTFSLLVFQLYTKCVLASISSAETPDKHIHAIDKLRFGVDKYGKGFFEFDDENGRMVSFSGLEHQKQLLSAATITTASSSGTNSQRSNHKNKPSNTYSKVMEIKQSGSVLSISMIIHSSERVSIAVSGVYNSKGEQVKGSFHISPRNHLDRQTKEYVAAQKLGRSLEGSENTDHFLVYTPASPWGDFGECGALRVDGSIGADPNDPSAPGVPGDIKIEDLANLNVKSWHSNAKVERMDGHRSHKNTDEFTSSSTGTESRRLENSMPNEFQTAARRFLRAETWENCYTEEATPRVLEIGIIADLGFFRSYDNDIDLVEEAIEVIVAVSSCRAGGFSTNDILNQDPTTGTCCYTIENALDGITALSQNMDLKSLSGITNRVQEYTGSNSQFFQLAHWHLLTDCYPADCADPPCTVGLAWSYSSGRKNALCRASEGTNVAVSSRTFQTWLTFAHELGHNFGSSHSFEDGEGTTGGIMDYGDGKFDSQYQFNKKYRFTDFCVELEGLSTEAQCELRNINFFPTYFDNCSALPDNSDCSIGLCFQGTCTPLETQLRIVDNVRKSSADYRIEPAEFSPFPPTQEAVEGNLVTVSPENGCSSLSGNQNGNIVLIKRGNCDFLDKARNALQAGAIGVVIYNNEGGPPKPIGGEGGFGIPVIAISKADGEAIINTRKKSANVTGIIGGFPASSKLFAPVDDTVDLWEEYYILWVIFLSGSFGLSTIYMFYMHKNSIRKTVKSTGGRIREAAHEARLKLHDKYVDYTHNVTVSNKNPIADVSQTSEEESLGELKYSENVEKTV